MKHISIILISTLLFFSCEKTIKIKIDDKGRKLVVNSIFEADSSLNVHLSESQYILTGAFEFISINNASVSLYENETKIETTSESTDGLYEFSSITKAGSQYKIEINSDKYGIVAGESIIPVKTNISNIDYETKTIIEYGSEFVESIDFDLRFKDNENETNFYLLKVYLITRYEYQNPETNENEIHITKNFIRLDTYDPSVILAPSFSGLIFNDDLFNGDGHTLSFYTNNFPHDESGKNKYYMVLYSLSKDLYNYYLSFAKYEESVGNPFAEPVKVYTNIENGFGIIAGSSASIDSVEVSLTF